MMDKLQPKDSRVLFASATLMAEAEVSGKQLGSLKQFRPRPFWDITALMEETHSRINVMGVGLLAEGRTPTYRYRTDFNCQPGQAKALHKDLESVAVPKLLGLLQQFLKMKVPLAVPKSKGSHFDLTQTGNNVSLIFELDPSGEERRSLVRYLTLVMMDSQAELAFFEDVDLRQQLAKAGKDLASSDAAWRRYAGGKKLPPDQFPPGAFPLSFKGGATEYDPGRHVGWMAALLPYMEQQALFDRINFDAHWYDSSNWPAGRTLVPQFIDPRAPADKRYFSHPDLQQVYGATHFVGIAGVGLDAGDSIQGSRRGILGDDMSATIAQVRKGRGLSQTMLAVQVPWDSPIGVTPWIAGGGATLRGVPEITPGRNCVDPFVLADGKGTIALMGDGSVRVISSKITDPVFQGRLARTRAPLLRTSTAISKPTPGRRPRANRPGIRLASTHASKYSPPTLACAACSQGTSSQHHEKQTQPQQ